MKYLRAGFSLIEFLVYFTVMSILTGFCMSSFMHFFSFTQRSQHATLQLSSLASAHDLLVRDRALSSNHDMRTVWRVEHDDIQWCARDGKLIREKGVYDYAQKRWIKKRDNVVADGVLAWELSIEGCLWKSELKYRVQGTHYHDVRYVTQRSSRYE